jgi:phage terminase small subunit
MTEETELTPKQRRFCEEYAIDFNGTQAAIRSGYSEHTAGIIASQNLTKLNVRNQIEKSIAEKSLRAEITADRVLQSIAEIAFAEKDVANRDKLKALEMLSKHFGLFEKADGKFTEIVEQSVSVEVTSEIPEHIRQIIDLMRPNERQRLRRSLEKKLIAGEVVDVEELVSEATDKKP